MKSLGYNNTSPITSPHMEPTVPWGKQQILVETFQLELTDSLLSPNIHYVGLGLNKAKAISAELFELNLKKCICTIK